MPKAEAKIVKKGSQGARGKYASLTDIVLQGFELPKMRTVRLGEDDYIEYFDPELKSWQQGARIVVPGSEARMTAPQAYGAALSYARRYSTLMYHGLATDDEVGIENIAAIDNATSVDELKSNLSKLSPNVQKAVMARAKQKAEELKSES